MHPSCRMLCIMIPGGNIVIRSQLLLGGLPGIYAIRADSQSQSVSLSIFLFVSFSLSRRSNSATSVQGSELTIRFREFSVSQGEGLMCSTNVIVLRLRHDERVPPLPLQPTIS